MKYPNIDRNASRTVTVSNLSGGMNLRDCVTAIKDNQLSDCANMWYKNGILKTRPCLNTSNAHLSSSSKSENEKSVTTRFHNEIKVIYDGCECVCASNKKVFEDLVNDTVTCNIEFEFQGIDKIYSLPTICGIKGGDEVTYFLIEKEKTLYCYISDCSIWKLEYSCTKDDILSGKELSWEKLTDDEIYIPTVYYHAKRSGWSEYEATMIEGYNLINNRYKIVYSAYNVNDSDETHPMRYVLPEKLSQTGEIEIELTSYDKDNETVKVVKHKIKYSSADYFSFSSGNIMTETFENGEVPQDGVYMFVKYNYVGFLHQPYSSESLVTLNSEEDKEKYGCNEDNVVITAPFEQSAENLEKVFRMTKTVWYGGASNGIASGSRVFLCGNTKDKNKSLILWSGLDNPLYFNENAYVNVGKNSEEVTAFGKQGENLVIFKKNEIYYTYYSSNDEITTDDLINQNVVDIEASVVTFPVILLNGFIGCDCPNTVQTCRNRLVWANSNGKVYTLCTLSQYNERNVYEISEMIEDKLKKYSQILKDATTADFDGHYVLFLRDCAFVADYNCYGFQYIYSYSKNEDANAVIPWHFWEFDFLSEQNTGEGYTSAVICDFKDKLLMRTYFDASVNSKSAFVGFYMDGDLCRDYDDLFFNDHISFKLKLCKNFIKSKLCTKFFELGGGVCNFNLESLTLKIGSDNGNLSNLTIITDQNEINYELVRKKELSSFKDKNFILPKRVQLCLNSVLKFGIKIECDGFLAFDGLSVRYRLLGGVR